MKFRKIIFLLVVVLVISALLGGCAKKPKDALAGKKAVYLINGSLGDNSFYDSGQLGMDKLRDEYGFETRTIECGFDAGQYEPSLAAAANFADLIFVISYGYEDLLKDIADKNTGKNLR